MLRVTRESIGLSLVLLLLFGSRALAAEQISACVNPAGQMRLVADGVSCRPQEELVTWNVQGPEGPEGPQGPQGPEGAAASGAGPAVVLDSNDTVVGRYLNRTGDVLVHIGADFLIVGATQQGFVSTGMLVYPDSSCIGAPAVASTNPSTLAQVALVRLGAAWLPDFAATKIVLPPGSIVYTQNVLVDGTLLLCTQLTLGSQTTLTPLRWVSLSGFVTPFRVE